MDWTDVHYRQLARLISKRTFLYTEMVVDSTLIHNPNSDRYAHNFLVSYNQPYNVRYCNIQIKVLRSSTVPAGKVYEWQGKYFGVLISFVNEMQTAVASNSI